MDTTVRSAITAAQNRLRSAAKRRVTTLTAEAASGTSTLSVASAEGIAIHGLIGIEGEVFYVTDVSGTTVSVIGAFAGTDNAVHASGSLVEVRYDTGLSGLLLHQLLTEIRSWGPELYQVATMTLPTTAGVVGYSTGLTYGTEALHLLRAYKAPDTGDSTLDYVPVKFRQIKRGPSALSSGKLALTIGLVPGTAGSLHLEYAKPFDLDPFALTTDLVADVGLSAGMVEVAYLGAAYRSLSEIPAVDLSSQVESRNIDEIQPGQITGVRTDLEREYRTARLREVGRLQAAYPPQEAR